MLPKVRDTVHTERLGVNTTATQFTRLGIIWRETSNTDVGLDGQIEYVDGDGYATGIIAGVQIKSGKSYFHDHEAFWKLYTDEKHRTYWENYPVPVILVLCDTINEACYWVDTRQYFKLDANHDKTYILIPKSHILSQTEPAAIFEAESVGYKQILCLDELIGTMIRKKSSNPRFCVSYFSLFINGLTDLCRQVYFDMSLAVNVAEHSPGDNDDGWISINDDDHQFLFEYIRFLKGQRIADINFSECYLSFFEELMIPMFIAPLTSKGKKLTDRVREMENSQYGNELKGFREIHLVQENLISIVFDSYSALRVAKSNRFQELFLKSRINV